MLDPASLDLRQLIAAHGYWLTFAGAVLEGETILVLAGLAANRGYLSLPALIGLGAFGGFVGDQIYFAVGRYFGPAFLQRFPRLGAHANRAAALVERHPKLAVIMVRFVYGLRIVGPVAIGMSRIGWFRFAVLNAIGAVVWASCWLGIGYLAGSALETVVDNLKQLEHALFVSALIVALIVTVALRWRRRRAPRRL